MANCTSEIPGLHDLFGTDAYSSLRIPEVRQMLIYFHAIFILCGTAFNLTIIFALLYFREQIFTNIANIFVFTLAASDVVLCGISMPIQLYYGIDEDSRVNTALCRTLFAGFGIPMYVSCLTILLIAVDRHRLIVKPTIPRVSIRTALGLIFATVTFSVLNAIPVGLYTESRGIDGFRNYCVEVWPRPIFRLAYSVFTFTIHFLLPLLVSGGLYLEIYRRLALRPEQLSLSKESERRKRRTTTLLACVVICFVICWTPWCMFSLLVEIDAYITKGSSAPHIQVNFSELTIERCTSWLTDGVFEDKPTEMLRKISTPPASNSFIGITSHVTLVDMILKLWAMGSACINPFLYGWLNRPIREAMITLYEIISMSCFPSHLLSLRRRCHETNAIPEGGRCTRISCPLGFDYSQRKSYYFEKSNEMREWNRRCHNSANTCANEVKEAPHYRLIQPKLEEAVVSGPRAADIIAIVESPTGSGAGDLE